MSQKLDPILQRTEINFQEQFPELNVDGIISAAHDLKNPGEAEIKLYLEYYYHNYEQPELLILLGALDDIISARVEIELDLARLGFKFEMDTLFRGIHFLSLIVGQAREVRRENDWSKEADYEVDIPELLEQKIKGTPNLMKGVLWHLKMEKSESAALADFAHLWEQFTDLLDEDLSQIDLTKATKSLNENFTKFLEKHEIEEIEMDRSRVGNHGGLQSHAYNLNDPGGHHTLPIGEPASFIRRFLDSVETLKEYYLSLEAYRPGPEIIAQIKVDHLKYGAKAAHLKFLEALLAETEQNKNKLEITKAKASLQKIRAQINQTTEQIEQDPRPFLKELEISACEYFEGLRFLKFEVPPATYIEAALYDAWKAEKNIDPILTEIHQSVLNMMTPVEKDEYDNTPDPTHIIVRSSAIHSEDGEHHTGAGIYESIPNIDFNDFEAFKAAVIGVWKSCDTAEAEAYRASINVSSESMGVIIQPQLSETEHIQFNSTKPQFKEFSEALIEGRLTTTFQKRLFPLDAVGNHSGNGLFSEHFRVDWHTAELDLFYTDIRKILVIGELMEKFVGKAVQLEILVEKSGNGSRKTHLVQMRPLPQIEILDVPEFPDVPYLYKGRGVGVGRKKLITDDVTIEYNSHQATIGQASIHPRHVGTQEAIIMLDSFSASSGHIEQQCVEQGVLLITNDPLAPMELNQEKLPDEIVIISNGFEGRIYDATLVETIQ